MALKQSIEAYELLDSATVNGEKVAQVLRERGLASEVITVEGEKGSTDFIRITVPGTEGKVSDGQAPTLGIIGRLGGIGARPEAIGLVSDADGAITAIACALKLADMARAGDKLPGDVIVATHICPTAPTEPHEPVPFMGSPVDIATMNHYEVHPDMDAVLSIDTTRGNWILNQRGFATSPTVKEGYILKISDALLDIMAVGAGRPPGGLPINMQDITPFRKDNHHLNNIMQTTTARTEKKTH